MKKPSFLPVPSFLSFGRSARFTKSSRGFTLLELLVVISIIGILIAMGAAAFTTAQRKARDARRRGDIKAFADAIEIYYSQNSGSYTNACSGALTGTLTGLSDPKTGASYTCAVTGGTTFIVAADLESDDGNCNCTGSSCSFVASGGDEFCMQNRQ